MSRGIPDPDSGRKGAGVPEGRKRSFEGVLKSDYAKYGMLFGCKAPCGGRVKCGMMCCGWPSGAIMVHRLGWIIEMILTKNGAWNMELEKWVPGAPLWDSGKVTASMIQERDLDIWICDAEPPRSLKLMEGCKVPIIVSTRRLWHSRMEDYSYQSVKVKHSECGGVTDGTWVFHVYRRDKGRDPAGPCKTAGRDMLSIIDSKRGGTSCPHLPLM